MRVAYLVHHFPELTETFVSGEVRALRALGHEVRVEAAVRAANPDPEAAVGVPLAFAEDDRGLGALVRLVLRHPLRCARDLLARRRWRREEMVRPLRELAPVARRVAGSDHLHAHFAAGAALDALRIGALTGIPFSFMSHGYDIFATPANLREKHARAAFAATACEYSARELAPYGRAEVIVMGVDEDLRRDRPHTQERVVVAVARLTEKKGLRHLAAAARMIDARVLVVGDGPDREGLDGLELLGARSPAEVREIVQDAAVLAMPSVIAADGDRDTMPVVVKESLALEVPVVASDLAGLPEVVLPQWGRLVPPGDPAALATALEELLALPAGERARMGAAGRAFVLEHASRHRETAKLAQLMSGGRCR